MTEPTRGPWDVSINDYHKDRDCVSHSSMEVFHESPEMYEAVYINETIPPRGTSDARALGIVVHAHLFSPNDLDKIYAIGPDCDRRSDANKKIHADFEMTLGDRISVTAKMVENASSIVEAVRSNRMAQNYLGSLGRNEYAVRWKDKNNGVWCKARFDRLLDDGTILDLKTAVDPQFDIWRKMAYNFGYHRQAAWYLRGLDQGLNRNGKFVFIVVRSSPPYEVFCRELGMEELNLGHYENDVDLKSFAACRSMNRWRSLNVDQLETVKFPQWCFGKERAPVMW